MNIKTLEVITNSIQQTEAFYTQVLQLPILVKTENMVSFKAGQSVLSFKENTAPDTPIYHIAFNIPEHQLNEAIAWSKGKIELLPVSAATQVAEFELWNANAVYFYDNNRNLLEFIARHDLKNDSDEPFSAQAIQCISEIGLVSDDVTVLADQLIADYQLEVFTKQPQSAQFAVLGDDNGLLILVEKGRNWFPTQVPAASFPLNVTITHKNFDKQQIRIY